MNAELPLLALPLDELELLAAPLPAPAVAPPPPALDPVEEPELEDPPPELAPDDPPPPAPTASPTCPLIDVTVPDTGARSTVSSTAFCAEATLA
ncbi:MAG: hypothetical protein M3155_00920 [Actinomycetota bacterium]|nr:hypothetical protein [Actinomycetota bacterium]